MLQGAGNTRQRGGARDAGGARSEGSGGQQRHYGARLLEIARAIGVPCTALELPITEPVGPEQLDAALAADAAISHLAVCHVDTGTGLLNPIEPLAEVARRRKVGLIVDAIASFGGLPIDARGAWRRGDRAVAQQVAGGRARHGAGAGAARSARGGAPAAAIPSAWICTASGEATRRTAAGASRRPPRRSPR